VRDSRGWSRRNRLDNMGGLRSRCQDAVGRVEKGCGMNTSEEIR